MAGDDYEKLFKLGSGSYGCAWLVADKGCHGHKLVLKEIHLQGLREKDINQALTEVDVLARCQHEHIITFCQTFFNKEHSILSIVMEYASMGDLHKQITQRRGLYFPDETILRWFSQLVSALDYIHARCILHRDVKPQNLFLTNNHCIKLGDFGVARVFTNASDKACTLIGTPFYLSPEVCRQELYSYASDMWAAGCVLYEMCCLCVPFTASNMAALATQIELAKYVPIPGHCAQVLHDLVQSLLTPDPQKRFSAGDIVKMDISHKISVGVKVDISHKEEKQDKVGWKRNRHSPMEREGNKKVAKNLVDNTTYTVFNHPMVHRLSMASPQLKHPMVHRLSMASPQLSAMIRKQRTDSLKGHRAVSLPDNPRPSRQHSHDMEIKGPPPCFNLCESVYAKESLQRSDQGNQLNIETSGCEWDGLSQDIYRSYTSSVSQHSQITNTIHNGIVRVLGLEVFEHLLTAVRMKIDFEELIKMDGYSSQVLPLLLLYNQMTKSVR